MRRHGAATGCGCCVRATSKPRSLSPLSPLISVLRIVCPASPCNRPTTDRSISRTVHVKLHAGMQNEQYYTTALHTHPSPLSLSSPGAPAAPPPRPAPTNCAAKTPDIRPSSTSTAAQPSIDVDSVCVVCTRHSDLPAPSASVLRSRQLGVSDASHLDKSRRWALQPQAAQSEVGQVCCRFLIRAKWARPDPSVGSSGSLLGLASHALLPPFPVPTCQEPETHVAALLLPPIT